MKIRVVRSFGGYKAGQEFEWADGMARVLISRGVVEPVREQSVEQATAEERFETAVIAPRKKQK